jgi:hypothetical protein
MSVRKLLLATLVAGAVSVNVHAQVSRVFVSVTGNDANVCSDIATPCRTLGGGITQVDPQGEVIVVTSGSYAGGTITKSVKINVAAGVVAFSGLPITIDPGAGATVVLRGLTMKAATPGTGAGITHLSGTLFVENTVVDGWQAGLAVTFGSATAALPEALFVKESIFRNQSSVGITVGNFGPVVVTIDDSLFEKNTNSGLTLIGGTGRISNTVLTANGVGAKVSNSVTAISFQRCEVSSNVNQGIIGGFGATVRVSQSTIVRNGVGLENDGTNPGTVETFGNNVTRGNVGGNNLQGTITTVSVQ